MMKWIYKIEYADIENDFKLLLGRPVYNRIPNCKGASVAGQKLASLEEFASAKCIEVGNRKL